MRDTIIFETERLSVRKLQMSDLEPFHKLQSNPDVMRYVTGDVLDIEGNKKDLKRVIDLYEKPENDFWIYAIVRRSDNAFIGTCALIKDEDGKDEVGYRFIEDYWGLGYGFESCFGLIDYCRGLGMKELVAYVVNKNTASARIIEKCNFKKVSEHIEPKLQLPETKYLLQL